jgi:hypothetical protein
MVWSIFYFTLLILIYLSIIKQVNWVKKVDKTEAVKKARQMGILEKILLLSKNASANIENYMEQETLMSKPYTMRTTDHSDKESFSFSFYCERCGREWRSPTEPFTRGGLTEIENEEALQTMCTHEHKFAYEHTNVEAPQHFNVCPKCAKKVCDTCFIFEEADNGNKCLDCKLRFS